MTRKRRTAAESQKTASGPQSASWPGVYPGLDETVSLRVTVIYLGLAVGIPAYLLFSTAFVRSSVIANPGTVFALIFALAHVLRQYRPAWLSRCKQWSVLTFVGFLLGVVTVGPDVFPSPPMYGNWLLAFDLLLLWVAVALFAHALTYQGLLAAARDELLGE